MIRQVTIQDIDRCYAIERAAYDGDEAATREKIERRIRQYPEGYIVFDHDGIVTGFINSGATDDVDLASEAFKDLAGHDPDGRHIVVFSVVVDPDFQGQGVAGKLLEAFVARMTAMRKQAIHLICRARHIGFYKKYLSAPVVRRSWPMVAPAWPARTGNIFLNPASARKN